VKVIHFDKETKEYVSILFFLSVGQTFVCDIKVYSREKLPLNGGNVNLSYKILGKAPHY